MSFVYMCVCVCVCARVCIFYVVPMRELPQIWCDKNKLLCLLLLLLLVVMINVIVTKFICLYFKCFDSLMNRKFKREEEQLYNVYLVLLLLSLSLLNSFLVPHY